MTTELCSINRGKRQTDTNALSDFSIHDLQRLFTVLEVMVLYVGWRSNIDSDCGQIKTDCNADTEQKSTIIISSIIVSDGSECLTTHSPNPTTGADLLRYQKVKNKIR